MFKFTIRELLWLTVVVALGLGWAIRERQIDHWQKKTEALELAVEADGITVDWGEKAVVVRSKNGLTISEYDTERPLVTPPNPSAPAPNLPSE